MEAFSNSARVPIAHLPHLSILYIVSDDPMDSSDWFGVIMTSAKVLFLMCAYNAVNEAATHYNTITVGGSLKCVVFIEFSALLYIHVPVLQMRCSCCSKNMYTCMYCGSHTDQESLGKQHVETAYYGPEWPPFVPVFTPSTCRSSP